MGKRELAREPSGEQGRKKNKKIWVISGTAAAVLLGGYLGLCAWVNGTDRILPNVSVAGLDVSGMTVEEAQTALDRAMEEYGGQIIGLVSYDGQLWSIAADKMGYGWSFPAEAAGASCWAGSTGSPPRDGTARPWMRPWTGWRPRQGAA